MKKLLISLSAIILLLFIIDRGGAAIMHRVHYSSNDTSAPKLRYLADSCSADILILGTSRANCHYVPDSISRYTGMTVYNGGIDASENIYSHYFMLCQVLTHHTPRLVILELMPADFYRQQHPFTSLGFFAPYIGRSQAADSVFRESGNYLLYKISRLYRYNSKAVSNLGGLILPPSRKNESGFLPLPVSGGSKNLQLNKERTDREIDSLKLSYLGRFVNKCRESGIELIFTVSPCFSIADSSLYAPLREYAVNQGIPLYDYHTTGLFHNRPDLFRDRLHLNEQGAREFTGTYFCPALFSFPAKLSEPR